MQKIVPSLWFDREAEEAMNFYVSAFNNTSSKAPESKIVSIRRYPDEVPEEFMKGMEGKVLTGIFELAGYRFMTLDGGPLFKFNPSISFFIRCESDEEVDTLWSTFSDGAEVLMPLDTYPFSKKYGWLQDKYGISWQIFLSETPVKEKIMPSLMFVRDKAGLAEEAMNFYVSLFDHSSVGDIARYSADQAPEKEGTVMYGEFTLEGQQFAAMDSANEHNFMFNEAISLYVECDSQQEVDRLWEQLSVVPEAEQCGWLKDKYGVSWQIIPVQMGEMLNDPDPERAERVMKAMLQMKKIELSELQEAYDMVQG